MKTFEKFIKEDFNSSGAIQFLMPVGLANFKTGIVNERMVFYEHVGISGMNLPRYCKSFLSPTVAKLMQSRSTDFRFLIYTYNNGFHVFAFDVTTLHQTMAKALDTNKTRLKKFPESINYYYLYHETQLLEVGDTIEDTWCFSFALVDGEIASNLTREPLRALDKGKGLKTLFKFSDSQWEDLLDSGSCKI